MIQLSFSDYEASAAARDAALAQVSDNSQEWSALALIQFKRLFFAQGVKDQTIKLTGEVIRHKLTPYVGRPHDPHAYGAFTMKLLKAGLIEKTGEYVPMTDPKSHARVTAVYRLVPQ